MEDDIGRPGEGGREMPQTETWRRCVRKVIRSTDRLLSTETESVQMIVSELSCIGSDSCCHGGVCTELMEVSDSRVPRFHLMEFLRTHGRRQRSLRRTCFVWHI